MIRNGPTLADGGATEADVAIVGAGAMGIALAVRLAGRSGRVLLVEAGDEHFRPADNLTFFKAESVDHSRHSPTELYRRRMLGGTTSVWGGRCIPFDREDFAATPERPGWPIEFAEVDAYVPDALEFADAGEPEFSATTALTGPRLPVGDAQAGLTLDRIERYSKPTNVWRKWREFLARSPDVTVLSETVCTGVLDDATAGRVVGLDVRTPTGARHRILAEIIVLACGGFETPRLLLASRTTRPRGLGNDRDLVGRYYMSHLVSSAENVGTLKFAAPSSARAFDFVKTRDGVYARRMILLSQEARQREGLPNIVFRPSRPPMDDAAHGDAVLSAMFLTRSLLIPPEYARSLAAKLGSLPTLPAWREHGGNIVADIPGLTRFSGDFLIRRVLASRKLPSVFLYRRDGAYPLEFNAEQLPNPDSRVRLGERTDSLGMPRLVVEWRYHEAEVDAICRAFRVLASAIAQTGLGEVRLEPDLRASVARALVPQGGHHIGTTRMGADASSGVVDSNCEVWGVRGLFVAGTGVLATSGFANPTLTALALAFRLAEHLAWRRASRIEGATKSASPAEPTSSA
ncbi:MAG TPA: GMC family oxidoreductase [Roseiarcus sp.]|nr:GMC family oxidoreductase [Roseiarcus sp.]